MMEVINIRSHGRHSHSTHLKKADWDHISAEVGWSYDGELVVPCKPAISWLKNRWKTDVYIFIGLFLDPRPSST